VRGSPPSAIAVMDVLPNFSCGLIEPACGPPPVN
jgi:hypothetical protein